jgi:hypothetical protein
MSIADAHQTKYDKDPDDWLANTRTISKEELAIDPAISAIFGNHV